MLYYNIKNYDDFKERFGTVGPNGKRRCNKVLLDFILQKSVFKESVHILNELTAHDPHCSDEQYERYREALDINIKDMPTLKDTLLHQLGIRSVLEGTVSGWYRMTLKSKTWYSPKYETDGLDGLCEDCDANSIRYINRENGKVYKMKASKMYHHLIAATAFGQTYLTSKTRIWLCEELTTEWTTYCLGTLPKFKLVVDDDFQYIYDSRNYRGGDFHSCMSDRGYHTFYTNCVDASAASLRDEDGKILARAVIYNKVHVEPHYNYDKVPEGVTYRLCERQYSGECNLVYMRLLVEALISGGHIDGYKTVGADCHSPRNFLNTSGEPLLGRSRMYIDCNIDAAQDWVSYQDSFKEYYEGSKKAYNSEDAGDYCLDMTNGRIEPDEWDEYHERYCESVEDVYYHGMCITCDSEDMEDFYWLDYITNGHCVCGWYHYEDICTCDKCGRRVLEEDNIYSDLTSEDYCCYACMDEAEKEYKERYWYLSEFSGEWYEHSSELTEIYTWNIALCEYESKTIACSELADVDYYEFGGDLYDEIDELTGKPYNYEENETAEEIV